VIEGQHGCCTWLGTLRLLPAVFELPAKMHQQTRGRGAHQCGSGDEGHAPEGRDVIFSASTGKSNAATVGSGSSARLGRRPPIKTEVKNGPVGGHGDEHTGETKTAICWPADPTCLALMEEDGRHRGPTPSRKFGAGATSTGRCRLQPGHAVRGKGGEWCRGGGVGHQK